MSRRHGPRDPIVITGIGMVTSLGATREETWAGVRTGRSGARALGGILGFPDGELIGAPVDGLELSRPHEYRVITLCRQAAREALADSGLELNELDRNRFGVAISGHMGDTGNIEALFGRCHRPEPNAAPWWQQFLPNTACATVANELGLFGPRICHSTACASGVVEFLSAVRAIEDGQCDFALAGSGEAIHPLFVAGFRAMRVLAHHEDPAQASRPFDAKRNGFVMGEGAAMLVLERRSHALARGANVYAEFVAGRMHSEAHHVTGLDLESEALAEAIGRTLRDADFAPYDVNYINAHGTGTQQNDVVETRAIRRALGPAAQDVCVSATKSMLGHLVNAAGSVELSITALALRDRFVPPTTNLTDPDPECDLDCVPLVGRPGSYEQALKLSVAFGGHIAVVALRRFDERAGQRLPRAA